MRSLCALVQEQLPTAEPDGMGHRILEMISQSPLVWKLLAASVVLADGLTEWMENRTPTNSAEVVRGRVVDKATSKVMILRIHYVEQQNGIVSDAESDLIGYRYSQEPYLCIHSRIPRLPMVSVIGRMLHSASADHSERLKDHSP